MLRHAVMYKMDIWLHKPAVPWGKVCTLVWRHIRLAAIQSQY